MIQKDKAKPVERDSRQAPTFHDCNDQESDNKGKKICAARFTVGQPRLWNGPNKEVVKESCKHFQVLFDALGTFTNEGVHMHICFSVWRDHSWGSVP